MSYGNVRFAGLQFYKTIQGWYEAEGPMQSRFLVRPTDQDRFKANPRWCFLEISKISGVADSRRFKNATEAQVAAAIYCRDEIAKWLEQESETQGELFTSE